MGLQSRVLLVKNDKVLLIHRVKNGKEYWVIPGGHIDEGETHEQAAIREVKEETNLDVINLSLLWEDEKGYVFKAKFTDGELRFTGPELENANENNSYELEWVSVVKAKDLVVYPEKVKDFL
ncbi:MAG: NUDIX domain-containing protein [Nanoarchaeota archaeon]|nr:NUDIX domain-containing protein [Nanoarchaeota archaeon]